MYFAEASTKESDKDEPPTLLKEADKVGDLSDQDEEPPLLHIEDVKTCK